MKLSIDNRVSNLNTDSLFFNIEKKEAFDYLEKLDGNHHTLLSLERNDGAIMLIGGGNEQYIVTVTCRDNILTLLANEVGTDEIELCAGGQYANFPPQIVVEKNLAQTALNQFYDFKENTLNLSDEY